jgi:microcystin-dependent protein
MADPFVAEIRIFPFTFPPKGWAFCNGQLLPLSQNTALFSLLGTTYGGDGKSTFALPDLQGSAAMHPGQGSGLSLRDLGEIGGAESITLLQTEMPFHTHALTAAALPGDQSIPTENLTATTAADKLYAPSGTVATLAPQALPPAGGSLPHNNMQPYLTLNFNIALQGVFPQRP